jgi:hypothetical protein
MKRYVALAADLGFTKLLIGLVTLAVVFAAVVYASIPSADGAIHGCYQANGGQLRIVDADKEKGCRMGEVAIQWPAAAAPSCPAGTLRFVGVCIETAARPADDYVHATVDCADEAKRLPLPGELLGFRSIDGITLDSGGEWTNDLADTDAAPHFLYAVVGDAIEGVVESTNFQAYRCVTGPQLD